MKYLIICLLSLSFFSCDSLYEPYKDKEYYERVEKTKEIAKDIDSLRKEYSWIVDSIYQAKENLEDTKPYKEANKFYNEQVKNRN